MTRKEALSALTRHIEHDHTVMYTEHNNEGQLRIYVRNVGPFCPLTYLCFQETGRLYSVWSWKKAAKKLGVPRHRAKTIVQAADGATHGPIRRDLLTALGLSGK